MTIFDIKPYSYWRKMYKAAFYAWVHCGGDTPRTVCKLYLLDFQLAEHRCMIRLLNARNAPERPRTPVLAPNTPAGAVAHEIAAIAPATKEGDDHATAA